MKKLMFATALAASAAAFADGPINAISFESYSADAQVGNAADTPDASGGDNGMYFYFDSTDDGSAVKAFGSGDVAAPNIRRPLYFASASPNANYLELSTEGGILWRSINTLNSDTSGGTPVYSLGDAEPIAAGGLYLDTLVQFTPTEDGGAPELGAADKLAIWLNVDSSTTPSTTNLMVQARSWTYDNEELGTFVTNFVIGNVSVQPGTWYRLTVKAYQTVVSPEAGAGIFPAFQIFVDGTELAATEAPFSSSIQTAFTQGWLEGMGDLAAGNKLFPFITEPPNDLEDVTLQGVGFKGSGALDDLVWTTENPFAGGAGGDDYKVEIGGSDVVVTPSAEDLAAVKAAVEAETHETFDVTDVAAVNAALAAPIGSTSIPSWQALFLGLPPTEAGLESFKIDSISFDENGKVVVTLPAAVDPKTGRGVDITIKLKSANTPDATSWTDVESASGTTFAPVQPGVGETKKFYKVVVEFAASAN